jgi:hypothetical protein
MESTLKTLWLTTGFANIGLGELLMIGRRACWGTSITSVSKPACSRC